MTTTTHDTHTPRFTTDPEPTPPVSLTPDQHNALLLNITTTDDHPLLIAQLHALTLAQLADWLDHPRTRDDLAQIERINAARERAHRSAARAGALHTLSTLTLDERAAPETIRKAATELLRQGPATPGPPGPPAEPVPREPGRVAPEKASGAGRAPTISTNPLRPHRPTTYARPEDPRGEQPMTIPTYHSWAAIGACAMMTCAASAGELIINGGAETGDLTGWSLDSTEIPNGDPIFGALTVNANGIPPCEGAWMLSFDAGSTGAPADSGVVARLYQQHQRPATATALDVEAVLFSDPSFGSCDPGRVVLTLLDGDGAEIAGGFDTGWVLQFDCIDVGQTATLPADAASFRLDLYARLDCGVFINTFYDAVSVVAVESPACPEDVTGDGVVDSADLNALLASFGLDVNAPTFNPDADINRDGVIDSQDLNALLASFGQLCA